MKRIAAIVVTLYFVYGISRFVKVKAYKRVRFGKVERVRAHYRRVWGR